MLTKEKCLDALSTLEMEIMHASSLSYKYKERVLSVSNVLFQLINEHFDFFERNEHNHKPLIECEKWELLDCVKVLFYQNKELKSNPSFELQLTRDECELIVDGLKLWEEELGWDVTLLIEKIEEYKSLLPKQGGVVECVEID